MSKLGKLIIIADKEKINIDKAEKNLELMRNI